MIDEATENRLFWASAQAIAKKCHINLWALVGGATCGGARSHEAQRAYLLATWRALRMTR